MVGSSGSPSVLGSTSVTSIGSSDVSVTGSPLGSSPVAVAVLSTDPLLRSVCVKVYTPVKVVASHAPGNIRVIGFPDTVTNGSLTSTFVKVTSPVLHTSNA